MTADVVQHEAPLWTPPPGRTAVVVRAVVAALVLASLVSGALAPRERNLSDLLWEVQEGMASSVTLTTLDGDADAQGVAVWRFGPLTSWTRYEVQAGDDVPDDLDMISGILEMAPGKVRLTEQAGLQPPVSSLVPLATLGPFAALVLLITGPQPRRATKWAWFWIGLVVPPLALAFVLLEPVPLWSREGRPRRAAPRLTGGRALLYALVLSFVAQLAAAWVLLPALPTALRALF